MQMSPLIAVHMSAALGAVALGPVAIWARKGTVLRPRMHRAFGYGFVTLMLGASISGMFIRDYQLPNIAVHRKTMVSLDLGACLTAGAFTLVPSRYLGQLVWEQWLGLL